jgi:hypothetical protein
MVHADKGLMQEAFESTKYLTAGAVMEGTN